MPRSFNIDERELLKFYRIGSTRPSKWEEIDVDAEMYKRPGSIHEADPLGLETAPSWNQLDRETQATTSLTSLTFDPTAYLSLAHPQATHPDLVRGVAHLKRLLEMREGAVRVLVEENFSRFVLVKGATECLYEEMKNDILSVEREHATQPLSGHLRDSVKKANQIFLPVLEASENTYQLRKTLRVFERSKFFFNLPSCIVESIATGHYEQALRDYRKGKFMLEHRPSQLLPFSSMSTSAPGSLSSAAAAHARAQQQQMRVLNKVWARVEHAMADLKNVLMNQLMDSVRSVDDQEKALETLLEIPGDDDLLWMYFDGHHTKMMNAMTEAYRAGVKELDCLLKASTAMDDLKNTFQKEFRVSLTYLYSKQSDSITAKSSAQPSWNAIYELIDSISEVLSSSLPGFWRISKDLIDGKFKKGTAAGVGGKRSPKQCRTMAFDIIKLYISLVSQLFLLSDMVVMSAAEKHGEDPPSHALMRIPAHSHSLSTIYHLQRILNKIQVCVDDAKSLNISPEAKNGLNSLMDSVKWRFMDILVKHWIRDARVFYQFKNWIATWDDSSSSTRYLTHFELFQRQMMTAALRIASSGGTDAHVKVPKHKILQVLASKVSKAVFYSMRAFLDGIDELASEDTLFVDKVSKVPEVQNPSMITPRVLINSRDPDYGLLVILSNINRFLHHELPRAVEHLESTFAITFTEQKHNLIADFDDLYQKLLKRFVIPRVQIFQTLLKNYVVEREIDWNSTSFPSAISPHSYKLLDYLIEVHALLFSIDLGLIDKIFRTLVYELVLEMARAFRQIRRFERGGLLRATLDTTFIQDSLNGYARDSQIVRAFENLINKQLKGSHDAYAKSSAFQEDYAHIKKMIADERSSTSVHFKCFCKSSESEVMVTGVKTSKSGANVRREREQPAELDFT